MVTDEGKEDLKTFEHLGTYIYYPDMKLAGTVSDILDTLKRKMV